MNKAKLIVTKMTQYTAEVLREHARLRGYGLEDLLERYDQHTLEDLVKRMLDRVWEQGREAATHR